MARMCNFQGTRGLPNRKVFDVSLKVPFIHPKKPQLTVNTLPPKILQQMFKSMKNHCDDKQQRTKKVKDKTRTP